MLARFVDIHAAADFIGVGAVELPNYIPVASEKVSQSSCLSRRIKYVPATGHPSRYFENTGTEPTRKERSVSLKAIVTQVSYHLFGAEPRHFDYAQQKDLSESISAVITKHDRALFNGDGCTEYSGIDGQLRSTVHPVYATNGIIYGLKRSVEDMVSICAYPTAIYVNPILIGFMDQEARTYFNVKLCTTQILNGVTVKTIDTKAGRLPIIPDWNITESPDYSKLTAYILTENLIEYHWLSDPNPRVFQTNMLGATSLQYCVVKFGGLAVKNRETHHRKVAIYL